MTISPNEPSNKNGEHKLKIQLVTSDFPPNEGGVSRYLYEITKHLPSDFVSVITDVPPRDGFNDNDQPFEIKRLTFNSQSAFLKPFSPLYYFANLLQKRDISFLLCGQARISIMIATWLVSKIRGCHYGLFSFGLDLLHPQTSFYKPLFNYLLKEADTIFVCSSAAEKILIKLNITPDKIHVIYPSVDSQLQYEATNGLTMQLRQKYQLSDKRCLLTIGRLVERKGHDIVLRTLPAIIKKIPDVHYLIVGRGPNEKHLKDLVKDLDLGSYVTFAGFIPDSELAGHYALCDVFVMISREIPEKGDIEGFGIVYLEANLLGKPIVAGRSGGVPDAVLHGETGLLVDPTNVQEATDAIMKLLTNEELAQQLGEKGRTRCIQEFNSTVSAEKVITVLSKVS